MAAVVAAGVVADVAAVVAAVVAVMCDDKRDSDHNYLSSSKTQCLSVRLSLISRHKRKQLNLF